MNKNSTDELLRLTVLRNALHLPLLHDLATTMEAEVMEEEVVDAAAAEEAVTAAAVDITIVIKSSNTLNQIL